MITLDTTNLEKVIPEHGLSTSEMEQYANGLKVYLDNFLQLDQDFYKVIDDVTAVNRIHEFYLQTKGKFNDIIVLGIGGSSLGTICLQQSLKHLFEHELKKTEWPRLHVLDNIDPALMREIEDVIDYEKTLFLVVTKSGGTPETLSQYFYFEDRYKQKGLDSKNYFVFVTDPEKGLLRKISREKGIAAFDVPATVGGRFSVLTSVGLLPAALIGIDIEKLLEGARSMRDRFLSESFSENLPYQLAVMQYLLSKKGKSINVLIPYSQKLIRFADWYRQLLAESIGKKMNRKSEVVHVGLTPVNALGATDQHSQLQLYNEGPNDKFFLFIEVANLGEPLKIPYLSDDESVAYLKNTSFNELLNIEKAGTEGALTQNDRPNITIKIPEVSPFVLGELFMLFEGATAFLGELYDIDAFDQPGVELSKNITKKLLVEGTNVVP